MVNMFVLFANQILLTTNWILETIQRATILLSLVVILQVLVRCKAAKGPMDLDTFVCNYLYHPLVVRFERYVQWVLWPRRRRGLAWLLFIFTVEAVLLATAALVGAIQCCSAALSRLASAG